MSPSAVRVLVVAAERQRARTIRDLLREAEPGHSFEVAAARSLRWAERRLARQVFDVVLLDLPRSDVPGLAALAVLRAGAAGDPPVVVLVGASDEALGLKAVHHGASDYLVLEQLHPILLVRALRHAIDRQVAERKRRQAEQALRASEARFRALFEASRDGIFLTDAGFEIEEANAAAAELFGCEPHELIGRRLDRLFRGSAGAMLSRELSSVGAVRDIEASLMGPGGETSWVLVSAAARHDETGRVVGYQATVHDITRRKLAEDRLRHFAFHDPLTGLPNRSFFADRLDQALAHWMRHREPGFGVLYVDLDNFKSVNDRFGHAAGDELLVQAARAIVAGVRREDTVARIGGDEFAVLADGIATEQQAVAAAERVQLMLRQPFRIAGTMIVTSASIGIAHPSVATLSPDDLLRRADQAMYGAKSRGGGQSVVYSGDLP